MRVLVTGSTGLIGRAVVAALGASGHQPVGLSRSGDGGLAVDLGRPGVADELASQPPCGAIIHAAAAIQAPGQEIVLTNCLGTEQMLALAQLWRPSCFVFLSSLPVIGRPGTLPITEDHPVDPPTPYHASKLYGEHLTTTVARGGLAAVSLRLSAPVGPAMAPDRILPAFIRRAMAGEPLELAGQGTRRQDYVDVRDVAVAIVACLEHRPSGVLNIAAGRSTSNLELAQACVETLGSTSPVRLSGQIDPEDGLRWEVSIDKATRTIGYRPRYSLKDSIRDVANGIRAGA